MRLYLTVPLVLISIFFKSQSIVNAYAGVTSISNQSVLAVSNVNEANHTFNVGGKVIVMQMQDNVIGTNTTNVSTFGNLSAIANAGVYEIGQIASRSPSSGTPTTVTLSAPLSATYNIGTNSSVQLVTFRNLGANFTSTANITGLSWNGTVGGLIAVEVTNTLTLNHRILADGIGFAGGAMSASADEGCDNSVYITNSNLKAFKGEGIYKNSNSNFTNGRARMINGGGGGSQNNSGGGGGSNYTGGGNGGLGWQCTSGNSGYGLGGVALSSVISTTRIFMGGGGGGGQQNNSVGSGGGNGGGIIFIKANVIATSTTCGSPIVISANGITSANSGNDGAGGGGGAGSILIQANSFSVTAACQLTVSANGGNGGNVTNSGTHGGGAGGGQGYLVYAITQPTVNVTSTTLNGTGGANDSGGSAYATGGTGSNNAGIVGGATGILPIELLSFGASALGNAVLLKWSTATEKNNDYFSVEKSSDGNSYTLLGTVKGAGTSRVYNAYELKDFQPFEGTAYYRLKQTDIDGQSKYSSPVSVDMPGFFDFSLFPNPVPSDAVLSIQFERHSGGGILELTIYSITGAPVCSKPVYAGDQNRFDLDLNEMGLSKGIYLLSLKKNESRKVKKLLVQ